MRLRTLRRTLCGAATTVLLTQAAPHAAGATTGITVTPNEGLVDGQVVRVQGDGLEPICDLRFGCSPVGILQCRASVPLTLSDWDLHCVGLASATSVGRSFDGSAAVRRTFTPNRPGTAPVVCGTDGCVVAAGGVPQGGGIAFLTAPITFRSK